MTYRAPGVPLRIYSYSICPLQLLGGSRGAILVMDDVTDLLQLGEEVRRMQLHLASIVESAGDLIISTDPSGAIMTWNSAAEKATGYTHLEVRGSKLADHIEEPQNLEVEACFRGIAEIDDRRSVEWPMQCRGRRKHPGVLAPVANDRPARRGHRSGGRRPQSRRAARDGGADSPGRKTRGARHGHRRHRPRNPQSVRRQLGGRAAHAATGSPRRPCSKSASAKSSPASTGPLSSSKACCVSRGPGRSPRRRRSTCSTC